MIKIDKFHSTMPVFDINKFKAPRAIRLLSQHGINALIPLKVYGRSIVYIV